MCEEYPGILCGILSVPQNIIMDSNNVMTTCNRLVGLENTKNPTDYAQEYSQRTLIQVELVFDYSTTPAQNLCGQPRMKGCRNFPCS
jgi:hypothetical protein